LNRYIIYHDEGTEKVENNSSIGIRNLKKTVKDIQSEARKKKNDWYYGSTSNFSLLGLPKKESGDRLVYDFIAIDEWVSYSDLYEMYIQYMESNDVRIAEPPLTIKNWNRGSEREGKIKKVIQDFFTLFREGGNTHLSLSTSMFKYKIIQETIKLLNLDISNSRKIKSELELDEKRQEMIDFTDFSALAANIVSLDKQKRRAFFYILKLKKESWWFTGIKADRILQSISDIKHLTEDSKRVFKALITTSFGDKEPYLTLKSEITKFQQPQVVLKNWMKIREPQKVTIELNRLFPTFPYIQSWFTILNMTSKRKIGSSPGGEIK